MDKALGRQAFETMLRHADGLEARTMNERYRAANLNQMGRYHVGHRNLPAAIEAFSVAIQCEPGDPEAYNNLGGLCWHLGDRRQARRFIESAMEIDPSDLRTCQNWNQIQAAGNSTQTHQSADAALDRRSAGRLS